MNDAKVLVIDADEERADSVMTLLKFIDCNAQLHASITGVTQGVKPADWSAIILGKVRDEKGLVAFMDWLRRDHRHPPLLVLPEHHHTAASKFSLHESACLPLDYPLQYSQLSDYLRRASIGRQNRDQVDTVGLRGPTGTSAAVRRVRKMIEQVASFDTTVLITGESGTGKEVVARAIHAQSARKNNPFVAVNCGAIPSELLESELFGHEKGAFTGAISARKGRFEMADGGTLFLDEIGDMTLPMQVKILRVLQERTYERVGGTRSQRCDVRVIAATHRNLEDNIVKGSFREDLFYRLNVFPIETPPLRERLEDLPALIDDLIALLQRGGRGSVRFGPDTINVLRGYHWPGNVRELSNLVERLAVLHPGMVIKPGNLPPRYRPEGIEAALDAFSPGDALQMANAPIELAAAPSATPSSEAILPNEGLDLKEHIEAIEAALIKQALAASSGVVAHAAKLLNTRRTTLVEKLRKYGLQREDMESLSEG